MPAQTVLVEQTSPIGALPAAAGSPGGEPEHRRNQAARLGSAVGERAFGAEEIFFSTTDRKGIIRSGNRVFSRVSGYSRAELVGRPHNLIRHPDMPRAVFRVFWEEIGAGRPIAAYVKNRAKDGRHYWVMATVVPCDGGYLSVRVKPGTPYFDTAQALYRELLALERAVEGANVRRREQAIETTKARLLECLAAAGFPTYEAFMRTALLAEVKQRETVVGMDVRRRLGTAPPGAQPDGAGAPPALRAILDACVAISSFLDPLVASLDRYVAAGEHLARKAQFMRELAEDVRRFALNAQVASARVTGGEATLGTVAALMHAQSRNSGPVFRSLADDVSAAIDLLGGMFFHAAATKLQAEMAMVFVRELLDGSDGVQATADDLGALALCLANGVDHLRVSLAELDARMHALSQHVARLTADLQALGLLELMGRIDAAHFADTGAVLTLFRTIAERISAARHELDNLSDTSRFPFGRDAAEARQCRAQVDAIRAHVAAL